MASEGDPSEQGESTPDTLHVRVEENVRVSDEFHAEVITYPQHLLNFSSKLINDGQFSIAAIVCHMACEIATERTLSASFAKKGIEYLQESVLKLFSGYSLSNERLRRFYTALTGDEIQKQPFWREFDKLATRRNDILHRGKIIGKDDANKSLEVAHTFVAHLKQ